MYHSSKEPRQVSRTGRFLQNTLATAGYQIMAMIMGFITPQIMIAVYGDSINGLIGTVNDNILYYFKYVEVGLAAAANAALYLPLAEKDDEAISGVVSAARIFYNIAGWLFMAATIAVGIFYARFVTVTDLNGNPAGFVSVFLLILSMGISGTLEFFTLARYRVLLTADQKTYIVSLVSLLSLLAQTIVLVVLPLMGVNVIWVRFVASLTILIRTGFMSAYAKKHYPGVNPHAKPNKAALSTRWDALITEMTVVFQSSAGAILGTIIVHDAAIMSVYIVYHLVVTGLWGILKMVTTGVFSIFGNLKVSGSETAFQRAYQDFESLYQSATAVLFGVAAVLIVPFADLYTRGKTDLNYVVPLLGFTVIAEAVTSQAKMPFNLMIESTGRFREVRWHCILSVIATIVCGLTLGYLGLTVSPMMALCGAMVGVSLGNLVRLGFHLAFVPREITHLPVRNSIFRIFRMVFTLLVIALPPLLLLPSPQKFRWWLLEGVGLVVWACAVTFSLAMLLDREAMRSLIGRAKYLLKKEKVK